MDRVLSIETGILGQPSADARAANHYLFTLDSKNPAHLHGPGFFRPMKQL
jgi:hypothetical protein